MTDIDRAPAAKTNGHANPTGRQSVKHGLNGETRLKLNGKKLRPVKKHSSGSYFNHRRDASPPPKFVLSAGPLDDSSSPHLMAGLYEQIRAELRGEFDALLEQRVREAKAQAETLDELARLRLKDAIYRQIREDMFREFDALVVRRSEDAKAAAIAAGKGLLDGWEPKQALIDHAASKAVSSHMPDLKDAAANAAREKVVDLGKEFWPLQKRRDVWGTLGNVSLILGIITVVGAFLYPQAKSMVDQSVETKFAKETQNISDLTKMAQDSSAFAATAASQAQMAKTSIDDLREKSENAISDAEKLVKAANDLMAVVGKGGVPELIAASNRFEKIAPEIGKILDAGTAVASLRTELARYKTQVDQRFRALEPSGSGAARGAVAPPTVLTPTAPPLPQPPRPRPGKTPPQIEN